MTPPKGFMFDLDGTLILSDRKLGGYTVIPGAVEVLEELERRDIPFLALTNGSAYPASVQGPKLRAVGLPIRDERLFTPNSVAAKVFAENGHRSVLVLGTNGVVEALESCGIACCRPGDEAASEADAVYTAWHPDCTMDDIHAAAGSCPATASIERGSSNGSRPRASALPSSTSSTAASLAPKLARITSATSCTEVSTAGRSRKIASTVGTRALALRSAASTASPSRKSNRPSL